MNINEHYPFSLVPLPYDYNAMEPYIDELTMKIHHDRHLKTYVDNLNKALENQKDFQNWTLEKLLKFSSFLPDEIKVPVKRNAGAVYNHEFFFDNLTSNKEQGNISPEFEDKLAETFGSFDKFKEEFKKQALSVFGSGYAWLVLTKDGELKIITTANQDTPISLDMHPIFCIDVWEHAYYLKHYNVRADYIDDWFSVVNLSKASDNFSVGKQLLK